MMQPGPKRNNPAESAQRAHGVLAHAAHMVAQAMHRETELEEYQRRFARVAKGDEKRMSRVAGAFLLLVLLASRVSASDPGTSPDDRPGAASAALAVSVSETPDAILLRIQASGDVEPGSVEIRFAGRETVVLARDADGRRIRSQPLRLPELVVEEGSSAGYDADGALVMTLRKQTAAQDAGPASDPEAAAR